jgi:hypothetical protein
MTHEQIYSEYENQLTTKYNSLIKEVENLCFEYRNECNNDFHLATKVKMLLSDDYHNFIGKYAMTYGLEELQGTELLYKSAVLGTELSFKLLRHPISFAEGLYQ